MGSPDLLTSLSLALTFIVFSAVFLAGQLALIWSERSKFETQVPSYSARSALRLLDSLDVSLCASQLGASLSSLLVGYFVFCSVGHVLTLLTPLPFPYQGQLCAVIGVAFFGLLHAVLPGVVAKTYALRAPEKTLRLLAPLLLLFSRIFRPFVYLILFLANRSLSLLKSSAVPLELSHAPTPDEIQDLVERSSEEGVFGRSEARMIRGVLGFSDTVAREIMTPRTDIVAIPIDATLEEVTRLVVESGFSRFPVIGEAIDDVRGILLVKDLLPRFSGSHVGEAFSLAALLRKPYFVPNTKPIDQLLNEFKRRKVHIAVVLNEHGGVDGLVTLEDVLEELVGDIFDESDTPDKIIEVEANGDLLVDGGILVADLNERFKLQIPEGEYDTIAGFIFSSLGRMPRKGDQLIINRQGLTLINAAVVGAARGGVQKDSVKPVTLGQVSQLRPAVSKAGSGLEREQELSVIVEQVQANRIETVRIQLRKFEETSESIPVSAASEVKA